MAVAGALSVAYLSTHSTIVKSTTTHTPNSLLGAQVVVLQDYCVCRLSQWRVVTLHSLCVAQ